MNMKGFNAGEWLTKDMRAIHLRYLEFVGDPAFADSYKLRVRTKGGVTIVTRRIEDNKYEVGVAICRKTDTFCRKEGIFWATSNFDVGQTYTYIDENNRKNTQEVLRDLADQLTFIPFGKFLKPSRVTELVQAQKALQERPMFD